MQQTLIQAFPTLNAPELSDAYIEQHPDLLWDVPSIPLSQAVPLYMYWCVQHQEQEGALVFDATISALNKYARAKSPTNHAVNFKFGCNHQQLLAVKQFLDWCETSLVLDYEPTLKRTIKNWNTLI